MSARCNNCHTCGSKLKDVLDGESWCDKCKQYRRYRSHGWTHALADKTPCLSERERFEAEGKPLNWNAGA